MNMKVFLARHRGIWFGAESIIVARDELEAQSMLIGNLIQHNMSTEDIRLVEIDTSKRAIYVIDDGDY